MRRPSPSFVIPAGISLALHATILFVVPRYAPQFSQGDQDSTQYETPAVYEEAAPEPPAPAPPPLPEFEIGESVGRGFASHAIPDEQEATAPEADTDQAFLSLDPSGAGDKGTDPTVARATGEGANRGQPGGSPPPPGVEAQDATATRLLTPFGMSQALTLPRFTQKSAAPEQLIAVESPDASSPKDGADTAIQAAQAPPIHPSPEAEQQQGQVALSPPTEDKTAPTPSPNPGGATTGGSQQPAADPARMSESESDPFSRLGTVVFREGRLDIRFGRKVKTRRPKLLLPALTWDALVLSHPEVALQIDIDETGRVTSVVVLKSSGSNDIDQPTRVSVYDWWFEPKKNIQGLPVPDQVKFVIGFR